jgi:cytochrome bd-type quinol oxidase subunit 2
MNYRKKIVPLICAVFMLLSVVPALAADPYKGSLKNPNPLAGLKNAGTSAAYDTAKSDPTLIISDIIGALLGLLGLIFIVLIIYAGFLWMTAQGNEEQIKKAKTMLVNATIGILVISLAYTITWFVFTNLIPKTRTDTTNMFQ